LGIFIGLAHARPQQQLSISGYVELPDGQRVTHTEVRVDGGSGTVTTDSGEFRMLLPDNFQPGIPVLLHVKGWVVIDPFIGRRGRTYVPKDDHEEIAVIVVRPGDPTLLTALQIQQITKQLSQHDHPDGARTSDAETMISAEAHELGVSVKQLSDAIDQWRATAQQSNQQSIQSDFRKTIDAATDATQSPERRVTSIVALGEFWKQQAYEKQLAQMLAVLIVAGGSENRPIRCMAAEVIGDAIVGTSEMHGGNDEERSKRISQLLYGSRVGWTIGSITKANIGLRRQLPLARPSNDCLTELDATREAIRKNWEYLRGVNLNDTDLRSIQLYSADLKSGSIMRADVSDANFECANLEETTFEGSNWNSIKKINSANVRNALPLDFRSWALARGAKDMNESEWLGWNADRPECPK
jgi:hypothetical protein